MQNRILLNHLLNNKLFMDVQEQEILSLEEKMFDLKSFDVNELLIEEGNVADKLYLIVSGTVQISKSSMNGDEVEIIKRKVNDFIGEMGLIENAKRSSFVRCLEKVDVIIITKDDFFTILNLIPQINLNISKTISSQLRKSVSRSSEEVARINELIDLNKKVTAQKNELVMLNFELNTKNNELENANRKLAIAIEHEKKLNTEISTLYERVKIMSQTDNLTGIHNRGSILEIFENNLNRCIRNNSNICCVLWDIDHFKNINDTYGHQAGDFVLVKFAELMKSNVRNIDYFGRYGGEEFLLVLPDTDIENGYMLANRLRQKVESYSFAFESKNISVTVSAGICMNRIENETAYEMIQFSDEMLYQSKSNGRNQITKYNH